MTTKASNGQSVIGLKFIVSLRGSVYCVILHLLKQPWKLRARWFCLYDRKLGTDIDPWAV